MSYEYAHALAKGVRLNQYEMVGILGAGGFGITYMAHDTSLDTMVAIKEYLPGDFAVRQGDSTVTAKSSTSQGDFDWGLRRFLDEARVLAKFRHPNIVRVNQVFEANSTAYLVMEYAKGESMDDLLKRAGSLSELQTKEIVFPVLDGLKRVHALGFLHRDIKPGNIIIRDEGGPVLIDFGAARQAIETKSRAITSIVTEGYAPLEQYDPSGNQGAWTDIYAIGGVAYKCLTGNKPPPATSRVRNDPLVPVAIAAKSPVSPLFASAIEASLRVFENDRPQNIDEFLALVSGMVLPRASPAAGDATRAMDAGATQVMRADSQNASAATASAPSSFVPAPPSPAPPLQSVPANEAVRPAIAQTTAAPKPERSKSPVVIGAATAAAILVVAAGGWFYVQQGRTNSQTAGAGLAIASVPTPAASASPPAVSAPPRATVAPPSAAVPPSQIAVATPPPAATPPQASVEQPAKQPEVNASAEPQTKKEPPTKRQASLIPPAPPRPAFFKTSFDCMQAASTAEHLVCSDNELAALDLRMADLYRRGLAAVVDTNEFAGEQRTWLTTQRDVCGDKPCLISSYNGRIKELQRWVVGQ